MHAYGIKFDIKKAKEALPWHKSRSWGAAFFSFHLVHLLFFPDSESLLEVTKNESIKSAVKVVCLEQGQFQQMKLGICMLLYVDV